MKRPLLLLLALGAAGCDRPQARVVPPKDSMSAVSNTSATPELVEAPVLVDTTSRQVALTIPDACDAFAAILAASATANGSSTTEVGTPRDTAMSFGETYPPERPERACRVAWSSKVGTAPMGDVLERASAAGWTDRSKLLSADGPDGSIVAVSRGGVACLVSGSWDGGDDSDSTYVSAPGFEIAASCFVNRPDRS